MFFIRFNICMLQNVFSRIVHCLNSSSFVPCFTEGKLCSFSRFLMENDLLANLTFGNCCQLLVCCVDVINRCDPSECNKGQ